MKTIDLKNKFINFFKSKGHEHVSSSSLVPDNDNTLLFTNAGMVQFKDLFTGKSKATYNKAVSVQRCVRAGGKHNDLENVGYTARHHTFFEMLGNFSFGDYFKRDAIKYAWEFLTVELKIPHDKLWVTVYEEDKESEEIWFNEIGIDRNKFSRCGKKDNFWAMGETGPCGPCTEIFYDHGSDIAGGPPGSADEDGDRYVEIWNLVFMQYNRASNGDLEPLPKPSVDTGMGLERIAAVMQGVHSNYDIDIFQDLIKAVAKLTNTKDLTNNSLKVIADHLRSCVYLVNDGVRPSNEGRGYVLRRIMRRAIRHGYKLGIKDLFLYKLVKKLDNLSYIEKISEVFKKEEAQFSKTLENGMKILEQQLLNASSKISGEIAFKLYDTYGFPVDLTADIAREHHLTVDMKAFEMEMATQKQRSKQASQFDAATENLKFKSSSKFIGYDNLSTNTKILEINNNMLVLENTPFYAESGGQVGDIGIIKNDKASFKVIDTKKNNNAIVHIGEYIKGSFHVGDSVEAVVNFTNRKQVAANHSATHLLHAALREVLGTSVQQKGSLVNASKLRFDFSYDAVLTIEELLKIEGIVNNKIWQNSIITTELMDLEQAKTSGAIGLFSEKYSAKVRVLTMAEGFSKELCGGTHALRTGDIGLFKIIAETSVAAGIRRIEAVTGNIAFELLNNDYNVINTIASTLKCNKNNITDKISSILKEQEKLKKENALLQQKQASNEISASNINGVNVIAQCVDNLAMQDLRALVDKLKAKYAPSVVLLANVVDDQKISIVAGVTKDLTDKFNAGKLVNIVASHIGGKGGGRADMAQGGGSDVTKLQKALQLVMDEITKFK